MIRLLKTLLAKVFERALLPTTSGPWYKDRAEFMKLPMSERRRLMAEGAKDLEGHYESDYAWLQWEQANLLGEVDPRHIEWSGIQSEQGDWFLTKFWAPRPGVFELKDTPNAFVAVSDASSEEEGT